LLQFFVVGFFWPFLVYAHTHESCFAQHITYILSGGTFLSKAIKADNEKEYEQALSLYRDALARFTVSLEIFEKIESRVFASVHSTTNEFPLFSWQ